MTDITKQASVLWFLFTLMSPNILYANGDSFDDHEDAAEAAVILSRAVEDVQPDPENAIEMQDIEIEEAAPLTRAEVKAMMDETLNMLAVPAPDPQQPNRTNIPGWADNLCRFSHDLWWFVQYGSGSIAGLAAIGVTLCIFIDASKYYQQNEQDNDGIGKAELILTGIALGFGSLSILAGKERAKRKAALQAMVTTDQQNDTLTDAEQAV